MIVREIEMSDAEKLAALIQEVDKSSGYMLWEAGERDIQAEKQMQMIQGMKKTENSTILVADHENKLVGYLMVIGGNAKRNKHAAYIVVGIKEGHRGMGIGTKLFKKLDQWATLHHLSRLELTVVTKNERALSLYKKVGFEIEGTKRKALIIHNEFVDEYYMSKLL